MHPKSTWNFSFKYRGLNNLKNVGKKQNWHQNEKKKREKMNQWKDLNGG